MNSLTVTLYQQDIVWNEPEANRQRVEEVIAHAPKSDLFVVPETFTTGFGDEMTDLAEEQEGPTLQWARQMAAQYNLLFVGTWIVRENSQCFNRLHWVYPDGRYGTYDKGHTFRVSGEADIITRGTRREVFEYKGWRIKPAVCYDLRFPKWLRNNVESRKLNDDGESASYSKYKIQDSQLQYDLLLVCANWPGSRHEAWTTLLKARAIENQCYVVGCNRAGVDGADIPYTGNSAVINHKGLIMTAATTTGTDVGEEQTLTASLNKEKLDTFREHWPFYLDFD